MSRPALLIAAGMLLAACFAASLTLMRVDERRRRLRVRQLAVTAPYGRAETIDPAAATRAAVRPTAALVRRAQALVGMDPDRADRYPLSPWLVLPLAVAPGWASHWLLQGLLGPPAWLTLPAVWLLVVRGVYRDADARRTATLLRQLPDALGTIVRAVRVGIPVTEAMRAVAQDAAEPTAGAFARVHSQVSLGGPLEDALKELAARSRLPEYRFFATALGLQSQTGGGLTETLENLAEIIRKRVALKARGLALAAEARTSAGVLAVLPLFAGVALAVLNPAYILPLFVDGPGRALLGFAVMWLGLGLLVMRWTIRRSLA